MSKTTTFSDSDDQGGDYLWSDPNDWSGGLPASGDSVTMSVAGNDDIGALDLSTLDLGGEGDLDVTGAALTVTTVQGGADSSLLAVGLATPVTVTVDGITGSNAIYGAYGSGTAFVDDSTTDTGNYYFVGDDGLVELAAAPSASSELYFNGAGTIALENPQPVSAISILGLSPGDTLELPGDSVKDVTIGSSSLDVVTNLGSYDFTDVGYDSAIDGYVATFDPSTGLEAISFGGPDTFSDTDVQSDQYLWSDQENWSAGIAENGDTVTMGVVGTDDISGLNLSTLDLKSEAELHVTGASLTVATVEGGADSILYADADGAPVTVTIDGITGSNGIYGAYGAGAEAEFLDKSTTDTGNVYVAGNEGLFELSAAPSASSELYFNGAGTIALENPQAVNAVTIVGLSPGDTLELPGDSVKNVTIGTSSLDVTTNLGSFDFTDVGYYSAVNGYVAAFDSSTGLEAISFDGPDTFSDADAQSGQYLWSDSLNWSASLPVTDDSVTMSVAGTDDIGSLGLSTLELGTGAELDVTGASLTVATVEGGAGGVMIADARDSGAPVTVTANDITGTGGAYLADGAGAVFLDNSATVTANLYEASEQGLFELANAPSDNASLYFSSASTIALEKPAAVNAVALGNVSAGDTLELPGDSVTNVTFGSGSLEVTTNLGSYEFTHVTYGESVSAYVAAPDLSTGLEAITFGNVDTFDENDSSETAPTEGEYLWSDAANWSAGVPTNGNLVDLAEGVDDISSLNLGGLTIADGGEVQVTGSLTVSTVEGGTLTADGGFVELSAATATSSQLDIEHGGTLALPHASAVEAAALELDGHDDVLELPGSSVKSVTFGTNTLDITTNAGSFDFTNVTYDGPISGYSASFDSDTDLEAISIRGFDTFSDNDAQTTSGDYVFLWSDDANWSTSAPPNDGDGVAMNGTIGTDDINSLTLSTLTLGSGGQVEVTGSELTVGTVAGGPDGALSADTAIGSSEVYATPVDVTVGNITGSGGYYQADGFAGATATFVDNSPTDTGNNYQVALNGLFELGASPSSSSTFEFFDGGTFAFEHPQAVIDATLILDGPGDVLELPGSSILNVTIGSNSLYVATNDGSYDFTNVTYDSSIGGYSAAFDPSTGLEAITAVGFDTFNDNDSGPLDDKWSDSNNWSTGLSPANDGGVDMDGLVGVDDLSSLSLNTLALDNGGVLVAGAELTVNTVSGGGDVNADSEYDNDGTVTVTIGQVVGSNEFDATGSLSTLIDNSSTDAGNVFDVADGGKIELAAAPARSSVLSFSNGGTIAFEDPGSTIAAAITGVGDGDVLEVPGTTVSDVDFGPNSLEITTDVGTFDFIDVSYSAFPAGYSSAYDAASGLVAVTIACYLHGTRILAESGEVPIEELAIGDRIRARDGSLRPIRWIGRRRYSAVVAQCNREVQPVLIRAGALGNGMPKRDLRVSPDHGMYIDGMLILARDLINGKSIVRQEPVDVVTYYHLEFDSHAVIFAEGALAESFVDDESREMFDNAAEFHWLYPDAGRKPAVYCAPRVDEGWELERVRQGLTEGANACRRAQREPNTYRC